MCLCFVVVWLGVVYLLGGVCCCWFVCLLVSVLVGLVGGVCGVVCLVCFVFVRLCVGF